MTDVRGTTATKPTEIPMRGWMEIGLRTWRRAGEDHISLIAAGVAFYGLLAIFPAITALVAVGGLVMDPVEVGQKIDTVATVVPREAFGIIESQATKVAGAQSTGLGLAAIFGILLAIYSSSKGVRSLVEGLNIAYEEKDTRGFIKQNLVVLALTLFLIVGMLLGIFATTVLPVVLSVVNLGMVTELLISAARWVVMFLLTIGGIMVLYRYGPHRATAQWSWLSPGATLACIVWLGASMLFAVYADNFANYNESFGTLGGVIALLMWLWISAYVILLGAELDAEMEQQTTEDTTTGSPMPMGVRGATKADTPPPEPT
ncbi:YihY/virulence factor BrkB family protein [Tropicimonas isoalkanivorans]|uniref:Membrane protein n=1 Tax=Tropicimonas isoalkanivorans TaxID=441112 RepID=A0A1I1EJD2_9RHOB|nr:YihY/virulence factor BrkB family protein [Tropicimonas isoalkanivorans]SFB85090.1 membrane protein [Tropicimonas isoalkanivorans]